MRLRGGSRFGVSEEDGEVVWSRGPEEQYGQRVVCGVDRGQILRPTDGNPYSCWECGFYSKHPRPPPPENH